MKYDILTVTEESLSIEVVGGKIVSSRNKNITKKGVRLFEGNKIYTTSFVGDISDDELVNKAKNSKSVGISYEHELPNYTNIKIIDEESFKDPLEKIREAIDITHDRLSKFSNEFVFNGKFNREIYSTILKNDKGAKLERKFGTNEWYYLFKKVGSPNLMDGYIEQSGRKLDMNDVFERNIPYLDAFNNELKFQAGKYPVLFVEGGQLVRKLAQSLRSDKYFEGTALYSGKLNQKIFNDKFSLYDVNYSPDHGLYRKFDEEGTMRNLARLPLIENGTIKNVIADLRNAKKYEVESTGNGQRGYDSAAMLGFNSLVIGAGHRSTQDILKSMDNCIVVYMASGGDFTDNGDYSTPLQLCYLVQKGEIVGRLPQLTVKTSTDEMFNSRLIEIGSDGFQKNHMNPSLFTEMDVYVN